MPEKLTIPENYQVVMPYLIISNASAFVDFMQKVFGAREIHRTMRDATTIMHGEIMIGGCTIMFADCTNSISEQTAGFFIYVDNADECFKKAINAGATEIMPVSDKPYGRSGGVRDPFRNTWWVTSPF